MYAALARYSRCRSAAESEMMPSYILRTIDPDLWARVKTRAESDGIPLRAIILALLEMYADGKVNVKSIVKASRA